MASSQPRASKGRKPHLSSGGGVSGWGLLPRGSHEQGRARDRARARVQWRGRQHTGGGGHSAACGLCPVRPHCIPKPWVLPEPAQPRSCQGCGQRRGHVRQARYLCLRMSGRAVNIRDLPTGRRPPPRAEVTSYLLCLLKPTSLPNSTGVWGGAQAPERNPDTPCRSAACPLPCPLDSTSVRGHRGSQGQDSC